MHILGNDTERMVLFMIYTRLGAIMLADIQGKTTGPNSNAPKAVFWFSPLAIVMLIKNLYYYGVQT